jgi:Fic family protein
MNLILMKHGYPPAIVKAASEARLNYYESLEEASMNGNLDPFLHLIAGCVQDSLQRYIAVVK